MEHECIPIKDGTLVKIKGEFTIQWVNEFWAALVEAVDKSEIVEIALDEVTEMDVSALQLLCSAHRASVRRHKQLRVSGERPAVFSQTALSAGFARQTSCPLDTGNSCLWIMENK